MQYTKKIAVMYKGEECTVDVPCDPDTSFCQCKELAFGILRHRDEIREIIKLVNDKRQ